MSNTQALKKSGQNGPSAQQVIDWLTAAFDEVRTALAHIEDDPDTAMAVIAANMNDIYAAMESQAHVVDGLRATITELENEIDNIYDTQDDRIAEMAEQYAQYQVEQILDDPDLREEITIEMMADKMLRTSFDDVAEEHEEALRLRLKAARELYDIQHEYGTDDDTD